MVTVPQIPDWLARQYPFTPASFITAAGARLSYLDEGPRHDEAVLLLHGNPTWSGAMQRSPAAARSRTRLR